FDLQMGQASGGYGAHMLWQGPGVPTLVPVPANHLSAQPLLKPLSSLQAIDIGTATARLAWQNPTPGGTILVEVAQQADFGDRTEFPLGTTGTQYVVGGLSNNTHYYARVRTASPYEGYTAYSNTVEFTTLQFDPEPAIDFNDGFFGPMALNGSAH